MNNFLIKRRGRVISVERVSGVQRTHLYTHLIWYEKVNEWRESRKWYSTRVSCTLRREARGRRLVLARFWHHLMCWPASWRWARSSFKVVEPNPGNQPNQPIQLIRGNRMGRDVSTPFSHSARFNNEEINAAMAWPFLLATVIDLMLTSQYGQRIWWNEDCCRGEGRIH